MTTDVIARIVAQNLGVYKAAPSRLQEDVSQEAQVASDYRGRLVYELLQNADDAMAEGAGGEDKVRFVVTDDELWISNSGRALSRDDVQGLCGLGASSKVDAHGTRRASIGHKGLGFKSVLEITNRPAVFSRDYSFELGPEHARGHVDELWQELGLDVPSAVPFMRFPARLEAVPDQWASDRAAKFNTGFCFPFKDDVRTEQRNSLSDLLVNLPLTTVLFLKHLERVDVTINRRGQSLHRWWRIQREQRAEGEWHPSTGLATSGLYRVSIEASDGDAATFLVAHDGDVEIGEHRLGLSGPAWEGVAITEVSVAALVPEAEAPMPMDWRRFHVFLPTTELCSYPLLVNGAFATDLSRQHVKVAPDPRDYNRHLVLKAAHLFKEQLIPALLESGPEAVLAALDRGVPDLTVGGTASDLLHEALVEELRDVQLLPTELPGRLALSGAVLPPAILGEEGERFRAVLGESPVWDGRVFPASHFCAGRWAGVAADHGADELTPAGSLAVLATLCDPARSATFDDESGGFERDPILDLCRSLWERASADDRNELEPAARIAALFPVHRTPDRTVERCALGTETAFYPPRKAQHDLPLQGLRFMCHSLCWGALKPQERLALLDDRMKAWTAMFQIKEFRFEEVMRAAVLPALVLGSDPAGALLGSLRDVRALAAVCQLAGVYTKPDRPLRYQRLKSDRALFNLSRLPVPCRSPDGEELWLPAYRVYFGSDWIGDDSVERIATAIQKDDDGAAIPEFAYLAAPDLFQGKLPDYAGGTQLEEEAIEDDEVGLDEDTDQAIETDERDRWLSFLSWIGVNRALRPVHFHDVEDGNNGWLTTKDFVQPGSRAFAQLGSVWTEFGDQLRRWLDDRPDHETVVPYLYEVHDLDMIVPLLDAAEKDATRQVGKSLFEHLVRHWTWYSGLADAQVALIETGKDPNRRTSPSRAAKDEIEPAGDDLWLFRLKRRGFCPTSHGPRSPAVTWQASSEMQRRFGRKGQTAGRLFPLLEVDPTLPAASIRGLSERLGIRSEISPSTFGVEDARQMCEQLAHLYGVNGEPADATQLRIIIKPAYREMFELLSGTTSPSITGAPLAETPLLADTADGMQFLPARQILFASTPGIRERSGVAGTVPTFVLEAEPAAKAPLSRLFGVRVLEDVLEWEPDPGECPFDQDELDQLLAGMRALVAPLLARIRVERTESRDKRTLLDFVKHLEPVEELRLACSLDGQRLERIADRPCFVSVPTDGRSLQAFVVWPGPSWPPTGDVAQGLAMALADALGVNLVETFMAFIQSDEMQRQRLLQIAGAAGLMQEILDDLADPESDVVEPSAVGELIPTAAPEAGVESDERPAPPPAGLFSPAAPPVPLLPFDDLTMDGAPVLVPGEASHDAKSDGTRSGGDAHAPSGRSHAAPGTDLAALDQLGMRIALGYELRRLQRSGIATAEIITDPANPVAATSVVVDVHSPEAISRAETSSAVVRSVMAALEAKGISRLYPGFDILTIADGEPDRLIELKSSGVDARVQIMSWNEWKSARANDMRERFWLYLVGNLRADLANSIPFVKAIHDPFGTLAAEEFQEQHVSRAVQLRVREFKEAEHLDLGVRSRAGTSSASR